MTGAKRIAKLEAQVASLRGRLSNRNTQVIMLLDQIAQMKQALEQHGLEFEFKDVGEAHDDHTLQP